MSVAMAKRPAVDPIAKVLNHGYLDVRQVAEFLGVKVRTVHDYHSSGRLPPADAVVFRRPLWKRKTIEQYAAKLGGNARVHRTKKEASP
jgi:predicted DNA-binding transcriptional regulator AlpA